MTGTTEQRRRLLSRVVVLSREIGTQAEAGLRDRFDPMVTQNVVVIVLSHLRAHGPSRPRDLRRALRFTSGGTSNLLARLEGAGLVQRSSTAIDGDERAVMVELTEHGRAVESAVVAGLLDGMREATAVLKELQLTLDHLGAAHVRSGPPRRRRDAAALVRAVADVGQRLMAALHADRGDLSASLVMAAIGDIGPCRPRYLADRLALSTAGVAKLVDRLEADGLVRRVAGAVAGDRRAVLVELTDRGVAHLDEVLSGVAAGLDDLAAGIGDVSRALGLGVAAT